MEAGPCVCTCVIHNNTVTNSLLAARDAAVKSTHEAQLAAKDRQIAKHKWSNDDLSKQLFDLRKRCKRLANDLGFEDLWEAQVAVDTADVPCIRGVGDGEGEETPWTYRQALQSFEEMEKLRTETATIQAQNNDLTHSISRLRRETEETSTSALQSKLTNLQTQYDALLDVKERAAARYKVDYAKWKRFHDWVFTDDVENTYAERKEMTEEEQEREERKRWKESVKRKKRMMIELGPNFRVEEGPISVIRPPPLGGITNFLDSQSLVQPPPQIQAADKENLLTSPAGRSLPSSRTAGTSSIRVKSTPQSLRVEVLDSAAHARPFTDAIVKAPSSSPTLFNETTPSASSTLTGGRTPLMFHPFLSGAKRSPVDARVKQEIGVDNENEYLEEEATPKPKTKEKGKGKPPRHSLPLMKRKGKGMHPPPPASTPANHPLGQKTHIDYSAFKGRGRYGKTTEKDRDSFGAAKEASGKTTINAAFEIDPARNGGLNFQYDEVVRTREDRRRMNAGDCECCRDYYEAIGPLPNRLQAPLWRSPPATPAKLCTRHHHLSASASKVSSNQAHQNPKADGTSSNRCEEIASHRQAISRHRHHWERAKTPPGYWNIGFPDTQETEEINERAREMHRKKLDSIERAAEEGGRYRRRS
ncbi:hypothetical protein DXG03_008540 [Asterophora parasitica]|uniref:DNA endonuclease activator Ctp1 C-terminal domain-containing protein n=1 Tax=Asterophora parasitica TaxID=117018 RepID=A0A9P7KD15_9AGAR|nr:hypothetical protein DXG03_008540 [Asterophora parasitica]